MVLVVVFVTVLSPTYFGGPEIVSPLVEDIERVIVEDIDGYHDFAPPPPGIVHTLFAAAVLGVNARVYLYHVYVRCLCPVFWWLVRL